MTPSASQGSVVINLLIHVQMAIPYNINNIKAQKANDMQIEAKSRLNRGCDWSIEAVAGLFIIGKCSVGTKCKAGLLDPDFSFCLSVFCLSVRIYIYLSSFDTTPWLFSQALGFFNVFVVFPGTAPWLFFKALGFFVLIVVFLAF